MFNKNKKKFSAIITALLIAVYLAPLCAARIGDPFPYVPGAPTAAQQIDLRDITPLQDTQELASTETQIIAYRNVTLMLNSTRNVELNITVDETVKPRTLALSIEPNQDLLLAVNVSDSTFSGMTTPKWTLNFYMDIEPNATLELRAQMRLNINATELNQELNRAVNTSKLTWMYWDTAEHKWVSVSSYLDENGYLVCSTTHFSTWTVAEIDAAPSPTPAPSPSPVITPPTTATPTTTSSPSPSPALSPSPPVQPSPSPSQPPATSPSPSPSPSPSASLESEPESGTGTSIESLYAIAITVVIASAIISAVALTKRAKQQTK